MGRGSCCCAACLLAGWGLLERAHTRGVLHRSTTTLTLINTHAHKHSDETHDEVFVNAEHEMICAHCVRVAFIDSQLAGFVRSTVATLAEFLLNLADFFFYLAVFFSV